VDRGEYEELEKKLGHCFRNIELLRRALTHRSFAHEQGLEGEKRGDHIIPPHYEQLEFLGDAVVDLVIGHLLLDKFPGAPEGDLSRLRARLVNINSLSKLAKDLGLDQWIKLGKGEEATGGKNKPSILSDIYEAVCAAVYLDEGFQAAFDMIASHFKQIFEAVDLDLIELDYKTQLQELVQADLKRTPKYRLSGQYGPDHEKTFEVEVLVNNRLVASGAGKSKKEAEQSAAQNALAILKNLAKMEKNG
jgi:ribonuclease III